jgi:hypothetical protein
MPASSRARGTVAEAVSLRDIPATIAELATPGRQSPFPGRSLSRYWHEAPPVPSRPDSDDPVLSELAAPNPMDPNQGRSPARRGRLFSLALGDLVYIHNEGDGREELYDERNDPRELSNLLLHHAPAVAVGPLLQGFRDRLGRINPRSGRGAE